MSNPNVWSADERPIVAARLSSYPYGPPGEQGFLLAIDGWKFERFERNGEMAPLPYLRASHATQSTIEAPLPSFDWVQFEDHTNASNGD